MNNQNKLSNASYEALEKSVAERKPSDAVLITSIASEFGITYGQACDWVLEVAERMKVAA